MTYRFILAVGFACPSSEDLAAEGVRVLVSLVTVSPALRGRFCSARKRERLSRDRALYSCADCTRAEPFVAPLRRPANANGTAAGGCANGSGFSENVKFPSACSPGVIVILTQL